MTTYGIGVDPSPREKQSRALIAVIAAFAALVGALVGGLATVYAANRSANNETAVARKNFDREQLVGVYVKEVQAAQALRDAQDNLMDGFTGRSVIDLDPAYKTYTNTYNAFVEATASLYIVGSATMTKATQKLADDADQTDEDFKQAYSEETERDFRDEIHDYQAALEPNDAFYKHLKVLTPLIRKELF